MELIAAKRKFAIVLGKLTYMSIAGITLLLSRFYINIFSRSFFPRINDPLNLTLFFLPAVYTLLMTVNIDVKMFCRRYVKLR